MSANMLERYTAVPEQVQSIKAIEHTATKSPIRFSASSTRRSLRRSTDIHLLGSTMDDVIDLIDAAASRFVL